MSSPPPCDLCGRPSSSVVALRRNRTVLVFNVCPADAAMIRLAEAYRHGNLKRITVDTSTQARDAIQRWMDSHE